MILYYIDTKKIELFFIKKSIILFQKISMIINLSSKKFVTKLMNFSENRKFQNLIKYLDQCSKKKV